jgi:RecB family exonuclease
MVSEGASSYSASDEGVLRIVSSPIVRRAFQIREAEERGASVGLTVMTPGDLARRLLVMLPSGARLAAPTQELALLWSLVQRDLKDIPFPVSPLALPSFLVRLLATLRQLKQLDLHGQSLDRVARALDSSYLQKRWAFLSSLYSRYDEALSAKNLVGEVGVFHYLARHLERSAVNALGFRRMILHHLVDVTPAQAALFAALKEKGLTVSLALADIPSVREPAFHERLENLLGKVDLQYDSAVFPDRRRIDEMVAPTPGEEARWCARRARSLLRSGARPHAIFVTFRRPVLGSEALRHHFSEFSVTLAGDEPAVAVASAARLVLSIADLAVNDFPRWSMSLVLNAHRESSGLPDTWLQRVFSLPPEEETPEEEMLAPVIWRGYERWRAHLASVGDSDRAQALLDRIQTVRGKTPREFVSVCREICDEIYARDGSVSEALNEAAESLILSLEVARAAGATESRTLEVVRGLEFGGAPEGAIEPGRVGWGAFPDILGLQTDHVILVGVTDSEVPAPPPAPFILSASERCRVNTLLDHEVFLTRESHLLRERLFFESAVAAARASVLIARHQLTGSRPQYESPLVRFLGVALGWKESPPVAFTLRRSLQPTPEDVESLDDGLRATAAAPHPSPPEILEQNEEFLAQCVFADFQRLQSVALVPGYDGVIPADALPPMFHEYAGREDAAASPTRLARYGTCPFIFFAEKGLMLVSLPEEDAPPTLTLGTLLHQVLEQAIRPLIAGEADWPSFPSLVEKEAERTFARVHPHTFAGNLNALKRAMVRFARNEMTEMVHLARGETKRGSKAPIIIHPVAAEEFLFRSLPVGSRALYIKGKTDRVDRVDGDPNTNTAFLLTDYKSGTLPATSTPRKSLQAPLYAALLASQEGGATLDEIGFRYISVGKRETSPALSTGLRRGGSTVKTGLALAAAEGMIQRIRAGLFPPFPEFGDLFPARQTAPDRLRQTDYPCGNCAYLPVCRIALLNGVRKDLTAFGFTVAEHVAARAAKSEPAAVKEEAEQ